MTCDPLTPPGGTRSVHLRGLTGWDRPELRVPGLNAVSGLSPTAVRREEIPLHADDPGDLLHQDARDTAREALRDTAHGTQTILTQPSSRVSKPPAGGRGGNAWSGDSRSLVSPSVPRSSPPPIAVPPRVAKHWLLGNAWLDLFRPRGHHSLL